MRPMQSINVLDMRTLLAGNVVCLLICVIFMGVAWRYSLGRFPATGYWLRSLVMAFVGTLLLALRDQGGRRVGGGHHVEHGGLQVQGVENGGDGAHRARAPGCAARGGAWPPQCSNMLVSIVIGVLLTRLRLDTA